MSYIGTTPAPQMTEVGTGSVETQDIQDGAVTAAKLAAGAAVPAQTGQSGKFLTTNGTAASWATVQTGVAITSLSYSGDDLAVDPTTPLQCTLTGSGFVTGTVIYIDTVSATNSATAITVVSSTSITFTPPAGKAANNYNVWAVLPTGVMAVLVNGILYSGTPNWSSQATSLVPANEVLNIQLTATGDTPLVYSLVSGTLPTGTTLSSSGLISGTATVEAVFPNIVIRATDPQNQDASVTIQITISLSDPYFKYTTMLLNGNALVTPFHSDASASNYPITVYGDARADSFTPFRGDGYYGSYFDGSGDYLTAPAACGALGTGDFTVECWYRSSGGHGTYARVTSKGIVASATEGAWGLGVYRSGNEFYWSSYYSSAFNDVTTGINLNDGQWHHIAATRVGTALRMYSDGVLRATGTLPANINFGSTSGPLMVGYQTRDANYINAEVSNLRVVIGTALYTGSTYTVPTTPLTAVTNTALLTCQSSRFVDKSSAANAISVFGDAKVTAAQPFTLPTNIATYGSGYFDGSNDGLTINGGTGIPAAGDFTYETWIYPTTVSPTYQQIIHGSGTTNLNGTYGFQLLLNGSTLYLWNNLSHQTAVVPNQWQHVALVRQGTTVRLYLNGVQSTGSITSSNIATPMTIGTNSPAGSGTEHFNGYQSNARYIVGTALYTASFTPPTAPLTAVSGTQLLTMQYNGSHSNNVFVDSSLNNAYITRSGNTTQGTFSPYGNRWSNYFDGTGDYLTVPANAAFNFSTGDFTVECWINLSGSQTDRHLIGTADPWFGNGGWNIVILSSGINVDGNGNSQAAFNYTWQFGVWYHLAINRTGTNLHAYINGVSLGVNTITTNNTIRNTFNSTTGPLYVGCHPSYTNYGFNGYISNARIVTGTGLYPNGTTFTPATAPLTAISGTSLLTCQSNRFVDNSTNAAAITTTGDVNVQRFSPFAPTVAYSTSVFSGSAYFDGTTDYLVVPNSNQLNLSSADFTIEFWFYYLPTGGTHYIACYNTGSAQNNQYDYVASIVSTGAARIDNFSSNSQLFVSSTALCMPNAWNHVAITRSGTSATVYVNGVGTTGTLYATSNANAGATLKIGADHAGAYSNTKGYVSDLRIVKGSRVYTANFTPPTAPLTNIANTSLLCNFTNVGILDNAMMSDLETIGNSMISTSTKKYGTSSLYFDGTNSNLAYYTNLQNLQFGTGDFTIECWVNKSANGANAYDAVIGLGSTGQATQGWYLEVSTSRGIYFIINNTAVSYATWANDGLWHHIAVTRSNGTVYIFKDGTLLTSGAMATAVPTTATTARIGNYYNGTTNYYFNGYIDDLRITKGYARYTANFTPPSAELKGR